MEFLACSLIKQGYDLRSHKRVGYVNDISNLRLFLLCVERLVWFLLVYDGARYCEFLDFSAIYSRVAKLAFGLGKRRRGYRSIQLDSEDKFQQISNS